MVALLASSFALDTGMIREDQQWRIAILGLLSLLIISVDPSLRNDQTATTETTI
jgi:hypothetical protein